MSPEAYDHLIDAERDTLARAGKRVDKIALIKAVRDATGIGLRQARDAVDGYLARRSGGSDADGSVGWVDGLLDAERAAAGRDGRPITRIALIRAVRDATGIGPRQARDAVDDYLGRRGGPGLGAGRGAGRLVGLLVLVAAAMAGLAYAWSRS